MKGLMIKDLRILKSQSRSMILLLAMVLVLGFSMDHTFVVSYCPMVAALLVLSTIAYDYLDNGLSFLMTMPVSQKQYAVEKYVFSGIGIFLAWFFSIGLQTAMILLRHEQVDPKVILLTDALLFPVFLLIISIMIPVDLKYSPEKGRIVMFFIFGIIMICAIVGRQILGFLAAKMNLDTAKLLSGLQSVSPWEMIIAAYIFTAAILLISLSISIQIMRKKEF
ncbi:MAG: ABC-2 transporter permease [Lachnospiraceae bacterium]|nr:ABC-2 transporter permease [Lachnospiraceae bacterium]